MNIDRPSLHTPQTSILPAFRAVPINVIQQKVWAQLGSATDYFFSERDKKKARENNAISNT